MDRRAALQRIAVLMGGTLSASTIAGVLGGCSTGEEGEVFTARTLTKGREKLVATLAELIIPETDTPGARAARVHEFIDNMLTDWYDAAEVERFLSGLEDVEQYAHNYNAKSFVDLDADRQIEILTRMEEESLAEQEESEPQNFFKTIKSLTLFGYYTSEAGATQELRVNPMGVYKADIPFSEVGRAWS